MGVVPQFEVRRIVDIWKPIIEAVTEISGPNLKLRVSSNIPDFEREFENGLFDFVYMNPYHLLVAKKAQGYMPLVRDIGRSLYGIIVVRKDSTINKIHDLEGKTIAFPAPNALGAALIPRAEFATKFKINYRPVYVRSHSSVYLNVMLKQTDAGGGVQSTLDKQKPEVVRELRVLYETARCAPHPIAAHPRVPRNDRLDFSAALMSLAGNPGGAGLLSKIPIKKLGPASLEDYEPLKALDLEKFYVRGR